MKRIGNMLTFMVLATLLLLNGTSREFIHSFTGHQDTVDHRHLNDHTDHHAAFENEHHHCEFLNFLTPVYHPVEENFQICFFKPEIPWITLSFETLFPKAKEHTSLRGPPVC
ncbi:MAG TPA: hypothetical protein VFL76_07455 [Edaphocola sp.]|nr:hypothetical protein [Edaphocola sp.]